MNLKVICGLAVLGIFIKIFIKYRIKWCTSKTCLMGKSVIVTGANTGIGFQAALEFAKRGANVILACRDEKKARNAQKDIINQTDNKNIFVKLVDMSSLKSVRNFAEDILKNEDRLDILVNNAGAGGLKNKTTEDGLDILMQINYFAPFLLTILLLDLLKKSPASRIVNVSSKMAIQAKLDVNNLSKYCGGYTTYSNSKLCNILFTMELSKRLQGTNVTVYSMHPGAIDTEIFRRFSGIRKKIFDIVVALYFKSPEEGAQTTIYTATEKGIEKYSGEHFEECQLVSPYSTAQDPELPKKVWEKTVELLKLEKEI